MEKGRSELSWYTLNVWEQCFTVSLVEIELPHMLIISLFKINPEAQSRGIVCNQPVWRKLTCAACT